MKSIVYATVIVMILSLILLMSQTAYAVPQPYSGPSKGFTLVFSQSDCQKALGKLKELGLQGQCSRS